GSRQGEDVRFELCLKEIRPNGKDDLAVIYLLDQKMLPLERTRRVDACLCTPRVDSQHEIASSPVAVEFLRRLQEGGLERGGRDCSKDRAAEEGGDEEDHADTHFAHRASQRT